MEVQDYYNQKTNYGPSKLRIRKISELLGSNLSGKKILDIGCGRGQLGSCLKDKGATVHGCDVAPNAVMEAQKVLDQAWVFNVESGDYSSFDKDYDIIIATELIEHLFHPDEFLENAHSMMDDSARLIITTPNFLVWTNRIRMLCGQFEYQADGFWDEGHIHFFTYKTFCASVKKAGLAIEAENHIMHRFIPDQIGRIIPNLFIFQIVARLKKL